MNLKIDPEFESKIPPLTEEEFQQLEENILSEGNIINPLIVWNGIIVDGHNRYHILQNHSQITFHTYEKQFSNRFEAVAWICKNQLGRRNLTIQQKKYLIGQQYEAEKLSQGATNGFRGNQHKKLVTGQFDQLPQQRQEYTCERIAHENGVGEKYVRRAGHYAKGVDAAEEVLPGIKQELLSGNIKPTETDVAAVARAAPEERPFLAKRLRMTKDDKRKEAEQRRAEDQLKSEPPFLYENVSVDEEDETPPEDTDEDAHATKPLGKPRFSTKDILQISEGLLHSKTVTEESILSCIDNTVVNMINGCNRYFNEYPRLLTEPEYKTQVLQILQKSVKFVQDIEKGNAT